MRHLLAILVACGAAYASQDQIYGLGGSSSGRVGGVTADPETPFAALYNPALLAAQPEARFGVSTSAAKSSYAPLRGVVIDSPAFRTDSGNPRTGDYQLPGTSLALWSVGLGYPFSLPRALGRRAGLGVVLSGPFGNLRTFRAATPYDFSALRYGTSDAQFKGTASAAVELVPRSLYFGAGVSFYITSAGTAEATVAANNPTGRLAIDVGLNSAAVGGLYASLGRTRASLVYRQEIAPRFQQEFMGRVQIGGSETLYQRFLFESTLYFEPHTVETEAQHDFGPVTGSVGLSYQLWTSYKPASLVATAPDAAGRARATELPALSLKNTVSPRLSLEAPFFEKRLVLALGYTYRPTPLTSVSGPGNLLDSDTHVLGVSFQHRVAASEWLPAFGWGLFGQYHWLNRRGVEKSAPDYVGAPRYEFSGTAYTYGVSLQAEL